MASAIDLNAISLSVYKTVLQLNQAATQQIGMDALWCRCLPYDNGEDVIVQEYTLHQMECPKAIKIVPSNQEYAVGNFAIDLFGMHQDVPMEISIDIETWKSVYGPNTQPQQGDFVLIQLLHKPYEVLSSVVIYTVGEQPTSYKCQLGVWKHTAETKEPEAFKASIDDLTLSQDRLFGKVISEEVADAIIDVETGYTNTTHVDPNKDFDINSINDEQEVISINGNKVAEAYYEFINADRNITYKSSADFANHWIFTSWFKTGDSFNDVESGGIKLLGLYAKEKQKWIFNIKCGIQVNPGDEISIQRGSAIRLTGTIIQDVTSEYKLAISASDCLRAAAKISNWWKSGVWSMSKYVDYNLISGECNGAEIMNLSFNHNDLVFKVNNIFKRIPISNSKQLDFSEWHYIGIDICRSSVRIIIVKDSITNQKNYVNKIVYDSSTDISLKDFSIDSFGINNMGNDICMTNIRLYENDYELGDNYKLDMHSEVTRNASKLIIVDSPNAANKMSFISSIK